MQFGKKENFAITIDKKEDYEIEVYVKNKDICLYLKNDNVFKYHWDMCELGDWLSENLKYITVEDKFLYEEEGKCAVELYDNAMKKIAEEEEIEIIFEMQEKMEEWYNHHSWFNVRGGSYLPEIFFRKKGNYIEISWNLKSLFDEIEFVNEKGLIYIDINEFIDIAESVVEYMK